MDHKESYRKHRKVGSNRRIRSLPLLLMFVVKAATSLGLVRQRLGVTAGRVSFFALRAKQGAEDTETQQPLASSAIGEAPPPFKPKTAPKPKRAVKSSTQTPRSSSSFAPPDESYDGTETGLQSETVPTASRSPDISSAPAKSTPPPVQAESDGIEFFSTTQFFKGGKKLPYPKSLSPSAIMEFERCPQSYFFQYILGLRQPPNAAMAKGSMAHKALQNFLTIPEKDRNLDVLHNFFRKAWQTVRKKDGYKELFADVSEEIDWGKSGLHLLSNYYDNEPLVESPNPIQVERWIHAKLGPEQIVVRGIIDRLDRVTTTTSDQKTIATRIVDYKSGCAPNLKYSPAMNEKIRREAFDQLLMYALFMRQAYPTGITPRFLRLLYLQSVDDGPAVAWDYDIGTTTMDEQLDAMEERILNVHRSIIDKLDSPDPFHEFAGCDRSFCYCHRCRNKFTKGLVWEPPRNGE